MGHSTESRDVFDLKRFKWFELVDSNHRPPPCDHEGGQTGYFSQCSYYRHMKTVAATEAKNRFGAIIDDAQREPVVIRRQDRDVAVVLSMADYQRLRSGNAQAFLDLRNAVASEAASAGLTDDKLDEILRADRA